jgi:hypothetical protein
MSRGDAITSRDVAEGRVPETIYPAIDGVCPEMRFGGGGKINAMTLAEHQARNALMRWRLLSVAEARRVGHREDEIAAWFGAADEGSDAMTRALDAATSEQIKALLRARAKRKVIAQALGVSIGAVQRRASRHGLSARPQSRAKTAAVERLLAEHPAMSGAAIARAAGCSKMFVSIVRRRLAR